MIPSVGRIVHYVLNTGPSAGQHRPALIVRVWEPQPNESSVVQLQVFTDGSNDAMENVIWRTSVHQEASGTVFGTWHQPEGADGRPVVPNA